MASLRNPCQIVSSGKRKTFPYLGMEGSSGGSSSRVGEGCVGKTRGQLSGVQWIRGPGLR